MTVSLSRYNIPDINEDLNNTSNKMYKFTIKKGKETKYNRYLKEKLKEFKPSDKPVPTTSIDNTDVWMTPNFELYQHLYDIGYIESLEDLEMKMDLKNAQEMIQEFEFYTISESGGIIFKRMEIAKYLLKKFHALVSPTDRYMYIYNPDLGIYEIDYKGDRFKTELYTMFNDMIDIREQSEIISIVFHTLEYQIKELENLWLDQKYICCKNGVYNIETKELMSHSHEYYFLTRIPVNYDPDATCPNIDELMQNVFTDEQIENEFEWIGYSLTPGNRYKLVSMYIGNTDSGRTTYFNLIEKMFGNKNIIPMEPQQVSQEFYIAQLHGMMLSTCADVGVHKIRDFHKIKQVTGNDMITANIKGKPMIRFVNSAKFWWATNRMPAIDDSTTAATNRLRIIECEKVISQDNQLVFDWLKYTTDEEISGLLNKSLAGLHILDKRGGFILPSIDERMDKHDLYSSSIFLWAEDCLDFTKDNRNKIFSEELYESYNNWCENKFMKVFTSQTAFIRDFKSSFHDKYLRYATIRKSGELKKGVIGMMFYDQRINDVLNEIEDSVDEDDWDEDDLFD